MIKKIKDEAGLSLVEMLAATVVLMLLALMMNTGLEMALHSYETMIAKSEMQLLVSTAVDAIADELRYARGVEITEPDLDVVDGISVYSNFKYISDSYYGVGKPVDLRLDSKKQIKACLSDDDDAENGLRVLSTGVYGTGGLSGYRTYKEYQVDELKVIYDEDSGVFKIYMKVKVDDSREISAETPNWVQVRCLNPPKDTTLPPP